jgi:hypothetical protein
MLKGIDAGTHANATIRSQSLAESGPLSLWERVRVRAF